MRYKIISVFLTIALLFSFTGCGKDDSSLADKIKGDIESETEESTEEEESEDSDDKEDEDKSEEVTEEATEEDETEADDAASLTRPQYYIAKHYDYNYAGDVLESDHRYSYLKLSKAYGDEHSPLRKSIKKMNKVIEEAEQDRLEEEKKIISGWDNPSDLEAFHDEWNIYVTRSDEKYFSVVTEQRQDSLVGDLTDVDYTGYNWDTETGEEIELSDILKDEDGFYDELTDSVYNWMGNSVADNNWDIENLNDTLRDYMNTGDITWAFFPQGVQVWIDAYIFSPEAFGVFYFFTDEELDAKFFKDDVVDSVPDEWIMMPVKNDYIFLDLDDKDEHESILISDATDLIEYDGAEMIRCKGVNIGVEHNWKEIKSGVDTERPYDVFLVHQDHQTVLLATNEDDDPVTICSYLLSNKKVKQVDEIDAHFSYVSKDEQDDESFTPYYAPNDPSSIKVSVASADDPDDETETVMSLDADGLFKEKDSSKDKKDSSDSKDSSDDKKDSSDSKKGSDKGLTSDEALNIADDLGNVCALEREDYDGDGKKEAFVVTGESDEYDGYLPDAVWFISSDGDTKKVRTDFRELSMYKTELGHYLEDKENGIGFFYGDCGGYGSGWATFIFGVKDGDAYEMDISMETEGFYQNDDGEFYTLTDDFTDGHAYMITELKFNKKTGQFKKGKVTDKNWLDT